MLGKWQESDKWTENMRGAKAMNIGKGKARTQMQMEVIKYSMKPYLSSYSKDVESESE